MRAVWMIGAAAAVLAGGAQAAELKIKHAAARVVVIPEDRRDVVVTITGGRPDLPRLQVRQQGGDVEIDGDLRNRVRNCNLGGMGVVRDTGTALRPDTQRSVEIRGIGRVSAADLPLITARVPMNADVSASDAVFGSIGRTESLSLGNAGCGDWTVANVRGKLEVALAGSGDVSAGSSGTADISIAGSGDVHLGPVAGRLEASIAGSGDVRVEGIAEGLEASILGSGDVRVAQVTGSVERSVLGSGDVIVGGQPMGRRRR